MGIISRRNVLYSIDPILRSIVRNIQEYCTKRYVQLYSILGTYLQTCISLFSFLALMLLITVVFSFKLKWSLTVVCNEVTSCHQLRRFLVTMELHSALGATKHMFINCFVLFFIGILFVSLFSVYYLFN